MLNCFQFFLEDDENYKTLVKVDESVNVLQKQLEKYYEDYNGIKQVSQIQFFTSVSKSIYLTIHQR